MTPTFGEFCGAVILVMLVVLGAIKLCEIVFYVWKHLQWI